MVAEFHRSDDHVLSSLPPLALLKIHDSDNIPTDQTLSFLDINLPSIPNMKLTTTLLPLVLSSLAVSSSFSFFGSDQQVLDDDLEVPGDNPLKFCAKSDDYILTISNVDLEPNPPLP